MVNADPLDKSRTMWDDDPASRSLGMELVSLVEGGATVAMTVRDDMVNGYAMVHGGMVATLADTAFAMACNSHGRTTVASGFEITFLESARLGERLVATAREIALRGRSGLCDVTVVREGDGTVIAEFRGRSRTIQRD